VAETDNLTWDDVPSSFIAAVTHDSTSNTLYVQFVDGAVYAYDKADSGLYTGLLEAESPGSFFHEYVRDVPTRQLEKPRVGKSHRARAAPKRAQQRRL
jgi:KTSC domain